MTTNQEQINIDLQGQLDELKRQLEIVKNKQPEVSNKKFKDIEFYQNLKVDNLIIKFISQATEPVILANQIVLWQDTDNNKTYIVANFNGTTNSIECI